MKMSKESEYGLMGLVQLAKRPAHAVTQLREVASAANLPEPFLAKTFRKLTVHGLLRSHRGRERGYSLARPPREISIREVCEAIEGADLFQRCIFWSNACSDAEPCPLHGMWRHVRPQLVVMMESATLEDLARNRAAQPRDDAAPPFPSVPAGVSAGASLPTVSTTKGASHVR
jgi:Rrf2 family protein